MREDPEQKSNLRRVWLRLWMPSWKRGNEWGQWKRVWISLPTTWLGRQERQNRFLCHSLCLPLFFPLSLPVFPFVARSRMLPFLVIPSHHQPIRRILELWPCLGARIAIVLGNSCGRCIYGVRAVLGSGPVRPQEFSFVCPLPVSSWWSRVQYHGTWL